MPGEGPGPHGTGHAARQSGEGATMSYQLGIDLGTTYTAAAVCRSSDRRWVEPEVVTLGTRNATVPSELFLPPDGTVVVGEAAERRALTDPDRVVREFKRRIGDPTPVVIGGRPWAPEELSARLVRWVVDRVAEREGGPAVSIAVTHPASWGTHKKELLARALGAAKGGSGGQGGWAGRAGGGLSGPTRRPGRCTTRPPSGSPPVPPSPS